MRKLLTLAWNDIRVEFSHRSELVFFLVLPLLFTAIIGLGLSNNGGSEGDSRYPVLVVDLDGGDLAARFTDLLNASEVVRPQVVSAEEGQRLFEDEGGLALLTLPQGFTADLLAGRPVALNVRVQPEDNRAVAASQALNSALQRLNAAAVSALAAADAADQLRPFASPEARAAYQRDALAAAFTELEAPPVRTRLVQASLNPASIIPDGFAQSSPGQLVTWVLTTLLGGASVFVDERIRGTLRRLIISPTRKATLLGGKILARLALGLLQMSILVGFGVLALRVSYGSSFAGLALLLLALGLAGTAMGVALGAFARTRSQAGGLSVLFSMLMAALGGCWWPLEVTPPAYQAAVKAFPSTWAMTGLQDLIVRGGGLADVLPEVGVLLAFAAAFFALGIWKLKFE